MVPVIAESSWRKFMLAKENEADVGCETLGTLKAAGQCVCARLHDVMEDL